MAQNNYQRSMKNIDLKEYRSHSYNPKGSAPQKFGNFSFEIELPASTKNRLKSIMQNDLLYYNHIIDNLTPIMRREPEFLLQINENLEKLWGEIAFTGIVLKNVHTLTETQLPKSLIPFSKTLFGVDKNNNRTFTEKLEIFCSIPALPIQVSNVTKRGMALEILKYFKEQAKLVSKGNKDQEFKTSFSLLEKQDILRKRHIQLLKSEIKGEWDEEKGESTLILPYIGTLKIPNWNITEFKNWDIAVINQSGQYPGPLSPWTITFVGSKTKGYLLKRLDVMNVQATASYFAAKRFD